MPTNDEEVRAALQALEDELAVEGDDEREPRYERFFEGAADAIKIIEEAKEE